MARLRRSSGFAVELANELKKQIEDGKFELGSQLPTEQVLCNEFGVSRSVVREAITILKTDGIIETFQGRGSFVASRKKQETFSMGNFDLKNDAEIAETFEFLMAHEVAASGLAAERRDLGDLSKLKDAVEAMSVAIGENRSGVEEDLLFHQLIVQATKNRHFIEFNKFLEDSGRNLIRKARSNSVQLDGIVEMVQREHQDIFDAILSGDRAGAEKAAEDHIRGAAKRLSMYIN